jgi:hypothetical protein
VEYFDHSLVPTPPLDLTDQDEDGRLAGLELDGPVGPRLALLERAYAGCVLKAADIAHAEAVAAPLIQPAKARNHAPGALMLVQPEPDLLPERGIVDRPRFRRFRSTTRHSDENQHGA